VSLVAEHCCVQMCKRRGQAEGRQHRGAVQRPRRGKAGLRDGLDISWLLLMPLIARSCPSHDKALYSAVQSAIFNSVLEAG
jgi:hypothetical protein